MGAGRRRARTKVAEAERRAHDLARAHQRIGGTVDERTRWVVEGFAARDPADLSTGERATLRDDLLALAHGILTGADALAGQWALTGYSWSSGDPVLTDDDALRELWRQISKLATAHQGRVPLPQAETFLERRVRGGRYVRLELTHRAGVGLATTILYRVAELLSTCERLVECPECHRLFVARRRQERHPVCARRARDRRRPSRAKGSRATKR